MLKVALVVAVERIVLVSIPVLLPLLPVAADEPEDDVEVQIEVEVDD